MQMKLKVTVAAAVAMLAGVALAQDAQTVTIASVAPMSGPQAHYGTDNANGVLMAVDDLNKENLTIGGKKIHFVADVEDDAADPKQGTAVAQKICDSKDAGVVGHLNSGTSIPASKIYNGCGIPMITGSSTNPDLMKPGYKNVFRITAYDQGVAEVFRKTALSKGMQVVDQQYTTDKATDFMAILTSIKAKQPDAISYGGMDAQAGAMLRQMDQLGMDKVKFFGGDGICTPELAKIANGAKSLSNTVCATGGASLAKLPRAVEWKKRYDAKYPGQFQIYSPYTYDATMVIADAMKRANSVDPKVYTPFIVKTDYKGVTADVQFEPNGELRNPAITLSTYKDGKKIDLN